MSSRRQNRLTQGDMNRMIEEYRLHNKKMKQNNNHRLCFASFEVYLDWRFGRSTASSSDRISRTRTFSPAQAYERNTRAKAVPSRLEKELESGANLRNATAKPDSNSYSGTYVVGIATMHKSNAVPVGRDDNPEDYSTMRRSN